MLTPNEPDIIRRLSEEIDAKYPIDNVLVGIVYPTASQISRLRKFGRYNAEVRRKLIDAGIDMDYVETGVRKKDSISVVKEPTTPYNAGQQESQPPFFRMTFRETDEVSMKQTRGNGYLEIELYMKDNAESKSVPFSRIAEPTFTEEQKMPMPIRIEEKPEGVIIKSFDVLGKIAAKPVQPDSRKEYEESL